MLCLTEFCCVDVIWNPDFSEMVIALSRGIAPLIGSYIGTYFRWRATFGFLAVCGLVLLIIALRALPETLSADQRKSWAIAAVAKSYFPLLKIRPFLFT